MFVSVNSLAIHFLSGNGVLISTKCSYPISLWWTWQRIKIMNREGKTKQNFYSPTHDFADSIRNTQLHLKWLGPLFITFCFSLIYEVQISHRYITSTEVLTKDSVILNSHLCTQHYGYFPSIHTYFFKDYFYVDHFKNLHWICYNIASVLCFGFLTRRHVGSPTRDPTCSPCSGRRSSNDWTAREVPIHTFNVR